MPGSRITSLRKIYVCVSMLLETCPGLNAAARRTVVAEIVIGLPLSLNGDETEWTAEVRAFGSKLAERTGVSVSYLDERLTSVMAEKAVRSLGLKRSEREQKDRVDAAAALLILQTFLDRRTRA